MEAYRFGEFTSSSITIGRSIPRSARLHDTASGPPTSRTLLRVYLPLPCLGGRGQIVTPARLRSPMTLVRVLRMPLRSMQPTILCPVPLRTLRPVIEDLCSATPETPKASPLQMPYADSSVTNPQRDPSPSLYSIFHNGTQDWWWSLGSRMLGYLWGGMD